MMKKYYAEIGVPKPAADFLVAADPNDVYWMNEDLAAGFKIEVTTLEDKKEEKPANQPGTSAPVLPPELVPPTTTKTACMAGATVCPVTVPKAFVESLMTKKPL
jgi:hypothetical protein